MLVYPQQMLCLCTPGFSYVWTPLEYGTEFWETTIEEFISEPIHVKFMVSKKHEKKKNLQFYYYPDIIHLDEVTFLRT